MQLSRANGGASGTNAGSTPSRRAAGVRDGAPTVSQNATAGSLHYDDACEPSVLYVSDALIAVDKPAGIIVHDDGTGSRTLTDSVRDAIAAGRVAGIPASHATELQALQRLDRDTSGIVLFSHRKRTQGAYDRLIAERRIEKRYLAVVRGDVPWSQRTFDWPIGRDRHDARRMRVSRTGKPACTQARVLARTHLGRNRLTLLDILLNTGRKHQIRVHLSHAGAPLLGDALYGAPDARGLMLHARRIAFDDPVSNEAVCITAPTPSRFCALFPHTAVV